MSVVDASTIPVFRKGRRNRNGIVICKSCQRPEYWSEMRWLNGRCECRDCYRSDWERMRREPYKWDDLDGPRPTMQEYNEQEEE